MILNIYMKWLSFKNSLTLKYVLPIIKKSARLLLNRLPFIKCLYIMDCLLKNIFPIQVDVSPTRCRQCVGYWKLYFNLVSYLWFVHTKLYMGVVFKLKSSYKIVTFKLWYLLCIFTIKYKYMQNSKNNMYLVLLRLIFTINKHFYISLFFYW